MNILKIIFFFFFILVPIKGIFAFETHFVKIEAILVPKEEAPSFPKKCEIARISGFKRVSTLSYPDKTLILEQGAKIIPRISTININIGCDLIIEKGAEISTNGATNGFIRMRIERDFILKGKISGPGGIIRIDVSGNFNIENGEISLSGELSSGNIRINTGGDIFINSQSIKVNSKNDNAGIIRINSAGNVFINSNIEAKSEKKSGGMLRLTSLGKVEISGSFDFSGAEEGGKIRIFSEKDTSVKNSTINLEATINKGGTFLLDSKGKLNITDSNLNSDGNIIGGIVFLNTFKDIFIKGNISASTKDLKNGKGGIISINSNLSKLTMKGKFSALGPNGIISISYCKKDIKEAEFLPEPIESKSCP